MLTMFWPRTVLLHVGLMLGMGLTACEATTAPADGADGADTAAEAPDTANAPPDSAAARDGADTVVVADAADPTDTALAELVALPPLALVPPAGFVLTDQGRGLAVYRKDHADGQPDWVTVVDLRVATVRSVIGEVFGAPVGQVDQRAVITHWDDAVSRAPAPAPRPRVMQVGAFFSPNADPAPLAHGLQVDGQLVSHGYGLDEYRDETVTLAWNNAEHRAAIGPWSSLSFESWPDVVGGLAPDAPHPAATTWTARSFAGVRDHDGDGDAEVIFLFASRLASQAHAAQVLTDFGATALIMFSGAETASLVVDGVERVSPGHTTPHQLAVFEGAAPAVCAPPCSEHGRCDAGTRACACDVGYAGPQCEVCADCAPAEVVVDDQGAGFTTFGAPDHWWPVVDTGQFTTRGYGGGFTYTLGRADGNEVWTGRWQTARPLLGRYRIDVHVPAPDDFDPWTVDADGPDHWVPCAAIAYVVVHDGAPAGEALELLPLASGWRTVVPSASFNGQRGDVRAHDRAIPTGCGIGLDAVRWTRL